MVSFASFIWCFSVVCCAWCTEAAPCAVLCFNVSHFGAFKGKYL